MTLPRQFLFFVPLVGGALLCSCASVSVKRVENREVGAPKGKPARIYVEPFSVANARVKENLLRTDKGKLASEGQHLLATALVAELTKRVAPAEIVAAGKAPPRTGWLVTGEITRLNEGSRLLRMGIGLGVGGTKLETNVSVRDLATKAPPFLKFSTTGGSNAQPGAATNPIPFSSAPTALLASPQGVTDDARRTARMITAAITDFMVQRGWLDPKTTPKPKISLDP